MLTQTIGQICRQTERNRIYRENKTEEIVQRRRVQTLPQMHGKARIGRHVGVVTKGGFRRTFPRWEKHRGKSLTATIMHIHHDIVIAIRQDNLPLAAVLHALDELYKRLTPHINDNKAEKIIPLPNGTRHRKDGILLIQRITIRR